MNSQYDYLILKTINFFMFLCAYFCLVGVGRLGKNVCVCLSVSMSVYVSMCDSDFSEAIVTEPITTKFRPLSLNVI